MHALRTLLRPLALVAAVSLAAALVVQPTPVRAESPYELDAELDVPLTLLGLATLSIAFIDHAPPDCLPDCDSSGVNAFDRTAMGNYNPDYYTVADIGNYLLLGVPLIIGAIDSGGDGWVEDSFVFLQAILVTQGATQLVKSATRRTAPLVYDPDVPLEVKTTHSAAPRSFWSGHTATAFAAGTAFTYNYWKRHPDDDARWVVLGVSAALATLVGLAKVEAGYHYWTDIIAGAGAGIAFGLLVPALHE